MDFDEIFGEVGRDPRNKRLDFCVDADHGRDADADQQLFKRIFYLLLPFL